MTWNWQMTLFFDDQRGNRELLNVYKMQTFTLTSPVDVPVTVVMKAVV